MKVYIRINKRNIVTDINSDVFINNTEGYIQVDEGVGDKYAHAQNNYLDKPVYDMQGRNNYIYENKFIRLMTDEEKELLFKPQKLPPTEDELFKAMVLKELAELKAGAAQ